MKGMWMGGMPPLGYEVKDRKLIIKEADAASIRWIFARFIEIGSGTELARELAARGIMTSRGNRIDKKYLYRLLNNRAYIGEAVHWSAPTEWSSLNVSAWSAFGLSGRCFWALEDGIPGRCEV
jgi:hypothetical protein